MELSRITLGPEDLVNRLIEGTKWAAECGHSEMSIALDQRMGFLFVPVEAFLDDRVVVLDRPFCPDPVISFSRAFC